jgi:hypothetical protein
MAIMMIRNTPRSTHQFATSVITMLMAPAMLMAGLLSSSIIAPPLHAQAPADSSAHAVKTGSPTHYHRGVPKRAESYYGLVWGLDNLSVKAVESGALIRFSYRVLDPQKAKLLNDKKTEAFLEAPSRNVKLSIPSLEKVGQLRQGTTEESGKSYWMAFSNPRRTVKAGDHINIVIGTFHANGLVIE